MADRVTFSVADATTPGVSDEYDLVTIFESLLDMSRPVEALRAARKMLLDGGSVVVAEELVQEEFTAAASDLDRYY